MWDLPRLGIEPVSPAFTGGFLSTVLPEKSPTWNLAWLLWPLLTLGSSACQNSCCSPARITWNRWKGMVLVIASMSEAPPVLVAPAVTSYGSHPMDKVFGKGFKIVLWPQAASFSWDFFFFFPPGTFWITGNHMGYWKQTECSDHKVSLWLQSCLTHRVLQPSAAPARKCSILLTGHLHPSWLIYQRGEILNHYFFKKDRKAESLVIAHLTSCKV